MFRNLSKRVEVVTPVSNAKAKARLWEVLGICLRDRRQAWVLGPDGTYWQLHPDANGETPEHGAPQSDGTHETLMNIARHCSE